MKRLDQWAEWLLKTRFQHQTDEERKKSLQFLSGVRDKVLDRADIKEGDVVLDVGTGTGLLTFGAIERVRSTGKVIASDISADCLEECRKLAREMKVDRRMEFLQADATALTLPDESVDVVWTPVQEMRNWMDQRRDRLRKENPTLQAILNFDEQDLWRTFTQAGFVNLNLDLRWSTSQEAKTREEAIRLLKEVGAPGQKSTYELLLEGFPRERVDEYVEYFASQVEKHPYQAVMPAAYLSGQRDHLSAASPAL